MLLGIFFKGDSVLVRKIFAQRALVGVDNVSCRTRPNRRKQVVIQFAVGEVVIRNAVVDAQQKFFRRRRVMLVGLAEINVVENFFAVDALIDKAVVVEERLVRYGQCGRSFQSLKEQGTSFFPLSLVPNCYDTVRCD